MAVQISEGQLRRLIQYRLVENRLRGLLGEGENDKVKKGVGMRSGKDIPVLSFLLALQGYYASEDYKNWSDSEDNTVWHENDIGDNLLNDMKNKVANRTETDNETYHEDEEAENNKSSGYGARGVQERVSDFVYYVEKFFEKYKQTGMEGVKVQQLFRFLLNHVYDKKVALMKKEIRGVFESMTQENSGLVGFVKKYQSIGVKVSKLPKSTKTVEKPVASSSQSSDAAVNINKQPQQSIASDTTAANSSSKADEKKVAAQPQRQAVNNPKKTPKSDNDYTRVFGTAKAKLALNNGKNIQSNFTYDRNKMIESGLFDNDLEELILACNRIMTPAPDLNLKRRIIQNQTENFASIHNNWKNGKYDGDSYVLQVVEYYLGKFNDYRERFSISNSQ